MPNSPFPFAPAETAITIAYHNQRYIADDVLPRTTVDKQEFWFTKYDLSEGFTIPNTKVGRKGQPREVEYSGERVDTSTDDYALDDAIPQGDISNAAPGKDVVGNSVERTTELILLDREKRTATTVFNPAIYGANQITLAGASQWSDPASDPIGDIKAALDAPVMRPNIMVIGQKAWSALNSHPDIVKAINRTAGDTGIVSREAVAALFELDDVHVGQSRSNTAKKGLSVTLSQIWGPHCALIYRDILAGPQSGVTFGFTGQWGMRQAGAMPDSKIGAKGGQRVRVTESVKEVVAAPDLAYFIQDAAAP